MANAIPLLEGTSTSGGTLLPPVPYGQTLVNALLRRSAVLSLARVQRMNTSSEKYSVYAGRPTAAFVAEAAAKPVTGAEYTEITLNAKKIATTVMYTEELLEDAREDPTILINADVVAAFDYLIDAHTLGYSAGSTISTSFDTALRSCTNTVEYDQTKDIAVNLSAAMALVEANGYDPTGAILPAGDARQVIRDARTSFGTPLFGTSFASDGEDSGAVTDFYGMRVAFSSNLPTLTGNAASGRVVGVVGDFNQAIVGVRKDMQMRVSNQATIDVSGTLHHLWQQNKTAALWEMRCGFQVHDVNRAFALLVNAA